LRAFRQTPDLADIPLVAVTASSLIEEENELRAQFSGYLRKPYSKQELFNELSRFLPPCPKVAPMPVPTEAAETPEMPPAPVADEVLVELDALMETDWPPVRDSVAINESKAFASKIDGLGQRWQCRPLIVYARTLRRHAESYAVVDLENTLLQFSAVAGNLRKAQA
jgi:CheY-like chemotaxis protein